MRAWLVAMAVSIVSQAACSQPASSQPADEAISRLKACFQLERAQQSECLESLSRDLADKKTAKFRGVGGGKLDRERNNVTCRLQSHD